MERPLYSIYDQVQFASAVTLVAGIFVLWILIIDRHTQRQRDRETTELDELGYRAGRMARPPDFYKTDLVVRRLDWVSEVALMQGWRRGFDEHLAHSVACSPGSSCLRHNSNSASSQDPTELEVMVRHSLSDTHGRQTHGYNLPRFYAIIEIAISGRTGFRDFSIDLPEGACGVDIVRSAEIYARGRGWKCISIATGANGALLPDIEAVAEPASRDDVKGLWFPRVSSRPMEP